MAAHAVPESGGSCSWEGMKSSHFLSTPTLPSACDSGSFQNLRTFLPLDWDIQDRACERGLVIAFDPTKSHHPI